MDNKEKINTKLNLEHQPINLDTYLSKFPVKEPNEEDFTWDIVGGPEKDPVKTNLVSPFNSKVGYTKPENGYTYGPGDGSMYNNQNPQHE